MRHTPIIRINQIVIIKMPTTIISIIFILSISLCNCWTPKPHTRSHKFKNNLHSEFSDIDPGEPLILTPLIESNYLEARNASRVHHDDFQGVESYSGFFTVNETMNSNLFFWFFPSEVDYKHTPVVLWLQGGPGGSSLFGLFIENGPFEFDPAGKMKKRQHSWTREHSVLYIDNPVGTGYSFTSPGGYATEETQVGTELYRALVQFFTLFPELLQNDFIISGESYAGKYVPAVGYSILKNNPTADLKLNLKGLAIGNGLTDPVNQYQYAEYLYQLGLIDSNAKTNLEMIQSRLVEAIHSGDWKLASKSGDVIMALFSRYSGLNNCYNYLLETDPTLELENITNNYVERNDIRRALHVGKLEYGSDEVFEHLKDDMMKSVAPWMSELLSNYRVLLYSGQIDIIVAYPLTLNYLQHLEFSESKVYKIASRKLWKLNGHIAGYVREAGNLTELMVRNAGHMVPLDQPESAYDLIYKFSRDIPFHSHIG